MPIHLLLVLQRSPVKMLNRNATQVNAFEAANIDGGYSIAFRIRAFPVWVNAARRAKAVLDNVLVERVCADKVFPCEQVKLCARDKPQERSFARAHGAITCHCPVKLAFGLERNLPAMTATFVFHV